MIAHENRLEALDHITDARRCLDLIELALRHNLHGKRCRDRAALAHAAFLASQSLDEAEAKLGAAA